MTPRSKTRAAWLALLLGGIGAHWFYLQGNKGWRPWLYLLFLPIGLPILAGCVEAIHFGLMPDALWNQRHNPDLSPDHQPPRSGALAVLAAILGFMFATTALMALLAVLFQWLLTGSVE
jgi:hypothetical protein